MNAKNLILATSLFAAAGVAMADGLSRADVRGELEREYAAGNFTRPVVAEAAAPITTAPQATIAVRKEAAPTAKAEGGKTRAEVRAELEREYLAGNYTRPVVAEEAVVTQTASNRTREDVRNEALQAAKQSPIKGSGFGG